jgi:hypothetical protein
VLVVTEATVYVPLNEVLVDPVMDTTCPADSPVVLGAVYVTVPAEPVILVTEIEVVVFPRSASVPVLGNPLVSDTVIEVSEAAIAAVVSVVGGIVAVS